MRPSRLLAVLAIVPALLAARCGLQSIVIDAPFHGALLEDPGHAVALAARVGTNFDMASVEVRLDGVDLVAALGLVPPFAGASGVVVIGSTPVSISQFSFSQSNPRLVDLVARRALRPVIERRYPLTEIVSAHRHAETGHKKGNLVIDVAMVASGRGPP